MKLQAIFEKIVEKAELTPEQKAAFFDKALPLLNQEVPDEANAILSAIDQFHTEKSALANRKIVEKAYEKKLKELQKALKSKLSEFELSNEEIDSIVLSNPEEAFASFGKKLEEKYRQRFSLSESERVKQEEELRRQEKERAERLQSQLLELDKRYKQEIERERANLRLQYLIAQTPKSDIMPADKANKIIMTEIEDMLKRDNAKIVEVGGTLRVVNAEDETLDVFDDRNVRVTIEDYIKRALKEVRLEPKEKGATYKHSITINQEPVRENSTTQFLKTFANNKTVTFSFERR